MIAYCLSYSVDWACATYLVMELVDLETFLTAKILTLSDRLQEAQYNLEEGFNKIKVALLRLVYHRGSSEGEN